MLRRLIFIGALVIAGTRANAADDDPITAVASRVSADYVRTKLPNGSFQPETYAFGPGGYWSEGESDKSIDGITFTTVAKVIAGPLELQGYLPTKDANTTKLLIMVYWGAINAETPVGETVAFQNAAGAMNALHSSQQAPVPATASNGIRQARGTIAGSADEENAATAAIAMLHALNAQRRQADVRSAQILGYDSWWEKTARFENTPLDTERNDMIDELEEGRYFVVLMAYDFQLLWKEKKHKLVWETRFSVRQRRTDFTRALPAMTMLASRYFGQDSHGLVRKPLRENVQLGELKVIGVESEK